MTQMESLRAIANAVLYEGYLLYPYRRSALKNERPGWSLGTLLPPSYVACNHGESSLMEGQVLASATTNPQITVEARFLQFGRTGLMERSLLSRKALSDLLGRRLEVPFTFHDDGFLQGTLTLSAEPLPEGIARISVSIQNHSHSSQTFSRRDDALQQALIAAHAVMMIESGEFISLLDPPEQLQDGVSRCRQTGVFPVMAGDPTHRNAMLISPIILYDYPQIAPESRCDFFDSCEIDEILTLRVMTLTEAEKQEMLSSVHGRELLQRTEDSTPEDMMRLHGTFRDRVSSKGGVMSDSAPFPACSQPSVRIFGIELKPRDRVRLCPQGRADIFDMALAGKTAVIEAIERTFEDEVYLAVTVEDDPGADLGAERFIGHRFFFRVDEVAPITLAADAREKV